MANVLLAHPNIVDAATLSGGSWQAPLSNLLDRRLAKLARSTSAAMAHTTFDVDLGVGKLMSVVALVRHNVSTQGRWRVRITNDATFNSNLYDSAYENDPPPAADNSLSLDFMGGTYGAWVPEWPIAWPTFYTPAALEWEADNFWSGSIPEAIRKEYPSMLLIVLPRPLSARYVRFEFDDTTNPDGYLEFGRVFLGSGWQPVKNAAYGATFGWETDTTVRRSLGGTPYFDPKPTRRVHHFELDSLNKDEALGRVFELQRSAGVHKEVLVIWDKDDPVNLIRQSYLARLRQLNPLAQPFFNNYSTTIETEEAT
ncbi:hypothetical protein [Cupriavidus necator]